VPTAAEAQGLGLFIDVGHCVVSPGYAAQVRMPSPFHGGPRSTYLGSRG
jgi:hypothetical protein